MFSLSTFSVSFLCGRCFAQSQPLLQITSPADGTVVHPGQTITVTVAPASGATFTMVGIVGQNPIESGQYLAAPPYQFSITIPKNISAGKYHLFAEGAISLGHGTTSPTISLDVEPGVPVSSIRVDPPGVFMEFIGEQLPLGVWGNFSDGSTLDITHSSGTTYSSADTTAVTVDGNGIVTTVGVGKFGNTPILVQYGSQQVGVMVSTRRLANPSTSGPNLTSITAMSGAFGTSVTLAGTNFGTTQGTSTVTFNGTSATPTTWSSTSIVVPVPKGATTGNVEVTVGGVASNGLNFTVRVPPKITSLSPTSGPVGTSVTITGTNFGSLQGKSTVTFNGTAATPTSWSATSIVAPVPSGATTGNVIVNVGGVTSKGISFTVGVPPPRI